MSPRGYSPEQKMKMMMMMSCNTDREEIKQLLDVNTEIHVALLYMYKCLKPGRNSADRVQINPSALRNVHKMFSVVRQTSTTHYDIYKWSNSVWWFNTILSILYHACQNHVFFFLLQARDELFQMIQSKHFDEDKEILHDVRKKVIKTLQSDQSNIIIRKYMNEHFSSCFLCWAAVCIFIWIQ